MMAAQGNPAEIKTAQLALDKSENEQVKDLAQTIIDDYTKANENLLSGQLLKSYL